MYPDKEKCIVYQTLWELDTLQDCDIVHKTTNILSVSLRNTPEDVHQKLLSPLSFVEEHIVLYEGIGQRI